MSKKLDIPIVISLYTLKYNSFKMINQIVALLAIYSVTVGAATTKSPTSTAPTKSPTSKAPTISPTSKTPTISPTSKTPSSFRPSNTPSSRAPTPQPTTPQPSTPPCTCGPYVSASPVATPTVFNSQKFDRIVVFVMENTDYSTAMSNSYMSNLATQGALFTNYYSCQHPSYPNYLNLVAAQDFGSTSDTSPSVIYGGRTIVDLFSDNSLSWKNYVEPNYMQNHHPLIHFNQIKTDSTMMANIVASTQFFTDWTARTLPKYSLYTSCCVEGQTAGGVPSLTTFLNAIGGVSGIKDYAGTLVQIVYDESGSKTACNANYVYNLFLGTPVTAGCKITNTATPYSVLRTIEDNFGLGSIGNAGNFDSKTASVNQCWAS